jgi:hypothetical protein
MSRAYVVVQCCQPSGSMWLGLRPQRPPLLPIVLMGYSEAYQQLEGQVVSVFSRSAERENCQKAFLEVPVLPS